MEQKADCWDNPKPLKVSGVLLTSFAFVVSQRQCLLVHSGYICFFGKEFKFKESYDYFKIGTSTLNDVISFDESTKNISVSSFDATVSIVKQGFVFIVYERMNTDDMTFLSSPVIKSITFYDDDSYSEIIKNENCYFELPYILPIDR